MCFTIWVALRNSENDHILDIPMELTDKICDLLHEDLVQTWIANEHISLDSVHAIMSRRELFRSYIDILNFKFNEPYNIIITI